MFIPEFFKRELKLIDKTYKVDEPEDHAGYFIRKDIDLTLKADDGRSLSIPGGNIKNLRVRGNPIVLWVPALDAAVLETLRKMKAEALAMGIYDNPLKELAFWQSKKVAARKKRAADAVDMISEGIMDVDKMSRRTSVSYGGSESKH